MSAEAPRLPIDLPGLTDTRFETMSADVAISTGDAGLKYPQLTLEGGDDAFEHSFINGRLVVRQKSSVDVASGVSFNGVFISSNGSIRINGNHVTISSSSTSFGGTDNRASLLLPLRHLASHDIDTQSGSVQLEALQARRLNVATMSGSIALSSIMGSTLRLNTMSGSIDIEDTNSENPVSAKTMSSGIDVSRSAAPSWQLSTMSGNIKARSTKGHIDASSMSGRTRIS